MLLQFDISRCVVTFALGRALFEVWVGYVLLIALARVSVIVLLLVGGLVLVLSPFGFVSFV